MPKKAPYQILCDNRKPDPGLEATVVIVVYNTGAMVLELIDSLRKQSNQSFEIIVINNGHLPRLVTDRLMREDLMFIKSHMNSLSYGRNIGVLLSRTAHTVFIDDDAIADENLISSHLAAIADDAVFAVRGGSRPKSDTIYNFAQQHYDLGDVAHRHLIDLPGNSCFEKSKIVEAGGFDSRFFGAEDLELVYKIDRLYKGRYYAIYDPDPIIYHDFSNGFFEYVEKSFRHSRMRRRLRAKFPEVFNFAKNYSDDAVVRRGGRSHDPRVRTIMMFGEIASRLGEIL